MTKSPTPRAEAVARDSHKTIPLKTSKNHMATYVKASDEIHRADSDTKVIDLGRKMRVKRTTANSFEIVRDERARRSSQK